MAVIDFKSRIKTDEEMQPLHLRVSWKDAFKKSNFTFTADNNTTLVTNIRVKSSILLDAWINKQEAIYQQLLQSCDLKKKWYLNIIVQPPTFWERLFMRSDMRRLKDVEEIINTLKFDQ